MPAKFGSNSLGKSKMLKQKAKKPKKSPKTSQSNSSPNMMEIDKSEIDEIERMVEETKLDAFVDGNNKNNNDNNNSQNDGNNDKKDNVEKQEKTNDKPLKVHGEKHRDKTRTVRIFPLSPIVNEAHLYLLFTKEANVKPLNVTCAISPYLSKYDSSNLLKNCRVGMVQLETIEQANLCVKKLTGHKFHGLELRCNWTNEMPDNLKPSYFEGKTNYLFLSNLPPDANEQILEEWILKCCNNDIKSKPKSIRLTQHPNETKRKNGYAGFATVEFNDHNVATNVLKSIFWKNFTNSDSPIYAHYKNAMPVDRKPELRGQSQEIILVNTPYATSKAQVESVAKKYGNVKQVRLWHDRRGYPQLISSIMFEDINAATKAFDELNNSNFYGNIITTGFTTKDSEYKKRKDQKEQSALKKALKKKANSKTKKLKAKLKSKLDQNGNPKTTTNGTAANGVTTAVIANAVAVAVRQILNDPTASNTNKGSNKINSTNKNAQKIVKNINNNNNNTNQRAGPKRGGGSGRGRGRGRGRGSGRGRGRGGTRGGKAHRGRGRKAFM